MGWRSGQSYSQDLRDRVLGAVDGGMSAREAAAIYRVSIAYIYKALIRRRLTGDVGIIRGAAALRASFRAGRNGRLGSISVYIQA